MTDHGRIYGTENVLIVALFSYTENIAKYFSFEPSEQLFWSLYYHLTSFVFVYKLLVEQNYNLWNIFYGDSWCNNVKKSDRVTDRKETRFVLDRYVFPLRNTVRLQPRV